MIYEPGKTDHGLPFDPFKSCVVPRPIGWISTLALDGTPNLAPFSQFNNLGYNPPYVMLSANMLPDGNRKNTTDNIEATGEFVWNMATWDLRQAVNISGQHLPADVDEFREAGLTKAPSKYLKAPRVAESPIHFECRYYSTLRLPGDGPGTAGSCDVIIGKVVCVHIRDDAITPDGRLDIPKLKPIARLGYYDYTAVEQTFEMDVPGGKRPGMQGFTGRRTPT